MEQKELKLENNIQAIVDDFIRSYGDESECCPVLYGDESECYPILALCDYLKKHYPNFTLFTDLDSLCRLKYKQHVQREFREELMKKIKSMNDSEIFDLVYDLERKGSCLIKKIIEIQKPHIYDGRQTLSILSTVKKEDLLDLTKQLIELSNLSDEKFRNIKKFTFKSQFGKLVTIVHTKK